MRREASVEQYLLRKIKSLGGLCFKFVSPGRSGVPDRIVIVNGRVYFLEIKDENGKLSEIQKACLELMGDHGADVSVAYGKSGVDRFIERIKNEVLSS